MRCRDPLLKIPSYILCHKLFIQTSPDACKALSTESRLSQRCGMMGRLRLESRRGSPKASFSGSSHQFLNISYHILYVISCSYCFLRERSSCRLRTSSGFILWPQLASQLEDGRHFSTVRSSWMLRKLKERASKGITSMSIA